VIFKGPPKLFTFVTNLLPCIVWFF